MIKYNVQGLCVSVSSVYYDSLDDLINSVRGVYPSSFKKYSNGFILIKEKVYDEDIAQERVSLKKLPVLVEVRDFTDSKKSLRYLQLEKPLEEALNRPAKYCLYFNATPCKAKCYFYRGNILTDTSILFLRKQILAFSDCDFNACFFYHNKWRPCNIIKVNNEDFIEAISISLSPVSGKFKLFKRESFKCVEF